MCYAPIVAWPRRQRLVGAILPLDQISRARILAAADRSQSLGPSVAVLSGRHFRGGKAAVLKLASVSALFRWSISALPT